MISSFSKSWHTENKSEHWVHHHNGLWMASSICFKPMAGSWKFRYTFNVKEDKKTVTKFWQFKPFPDIFNAFGFASKVFQFNLETGSNFPITEFETQFFKTLLRQTKPWARQLISFWHFPHKLQFDQVRGNVSMHVFEVSIYNDK